MRSLLLALSLAVASGSAHAAPTARYGSLSEDASWNNTTVAPLVSTLPIAAGLSTLTVFRRYL